KERKRRCGGRWRAAEGRGAAAKQSVVRPAAGKRAPRLYEGGFDPSERRRAHVELAAGGGHELAAEYFDARIDLVELSLQRLSDQRAELRIERQILADALDHLADFFAIH